jgi:hypothetical protein
MSGVPPAGPPETASGGFRIDREGTWRHEGQEVTHPAVLRNLYQNLRADGDGHFLQVGPNRIAVEVDDTPFVVTRIGPAGSAAPGAPGLTAWLSDGSTEPLRAESLWIGPRGVPYCRVKDGRFGARLAVAAWLQLARFAEEDPETGQLILVVGGRHLRVAGRP